MTRPKLPDAMRPLTAKQQSWLLALARAAVAYGEATTAHHRAVYQKPAPPREEHREQCIAAGGAVREAEARLLSTAKLAARALGRAIKASP